MEYSIGIYESGQKKLYKQTAYRGRPSNASLSISLFKSEKRISEIFYHIRGEISTGLWYISLIE